MKKKIKYILPILAAFFYLAASFAVPQGKGRKVSRADVAKSRYLYLRGLEKSTLKDNDAAYELFSRAVELNPSNVEAKMLLGPLRMLLRNPEVNGQENVTASLEMMREYVDRYPDDIDEGIQYAVMAGLQDTIPEAVRVMERMVSRNPDNSMALAYMSQVYAHQGEWDKAVHALDEYERVEGRNPAVTLQKMSMLLEGRDTVGAKNEVDRLISSNPHDYTYRILKGNLYEVMNELDSASAMYHKAQEIAPEASEPMVALMDIYRLRGDSVEYDKMLYDVLLTDDLDLETKGKLLAEYLQKVIDDNSDTSRGDYLFSVLESQYPHEPDVMKLAASYSAAKNDYVTAAEQIQYALDMDLKNIGLCQQLIYYLANAEKVDEALSVYHRADSVIEMPKSMRLYGGLLLQNSKRYTEAMDLYRTIVRNIAPDYKPGADFNLSKDVPRDITLEDLDMLSSAFTSMGDCAFQMKDTLESFRYYENALVIDPDNSLAANNYAYFSSLAGHDLDRARELSEKSLRGEEANNPTYLDTYGWILYLQGDYAKALEIEQRAIDGLEKDGREDADAFDHYGDILLKNNDEDKALEFWQKAFSLEPDRPGLKDKIKQHQRK